MLHNHANAVTQKSKYFLAPSSVAQSSVQSLQFYYICSLIFTNTSKHNRHPQLDLTFVTQWKAWHNTLPSSFLLYHVCCYKELGTEFQTIRLTARHLLADTITKVQPQFITCSAILIRQTKVVSFHYSKQVASLHHNMTYMHNFTILTKTPQSKTWSLFQHNAILQAPIFKLLVLV